MRKLKYVLMCLLGIYHQPLINYNLPVSIDLGSTNILDGGPKVESPGFYFLHHQLYYYANKFLNSCGKPLHDAKSPTLNLVAVYAIFWYQSSFKIGGGAPGINIQLPPFTFTHTSCNSQGLKSVDAGLSNPSIGLFFQFDAIQYKGRPLFIHRISSDLFLPFATNQFPQTTINPGDKMTCIDSCWAGSWYLTEHFSASWHLYYLWCGKNKKTQITPGQTVHMNYSLEYEVHKDCWLALNGYYLQQLTNDKQNGTYIPNSKERVFSAGPGFACFLPRDFVLLGHAYFETKVRNRTQGILALATVIKLF